jgi:NodT family efflux transporter outer membrane factor (OMF) lipoprotein
MSARSNCRSSPSLRWCFVLLALLSGCAVGPDFRRPASPAITQYNRGADPEATSSAQGTAQRFIRGTNPEPEWWRTFNSEALDALVQGALDANPDLVAAQASLEQSQDNLRSGYGIFYPDVAVGASGTRQRYSPEKLGQSTPSSLFNLFTLSASVSYALDIFGGQRRAIEALHATVEAQEATEEATYLTLEANIVNTTIARAAYREEIEATQELIGLQRQEVHLAEVQVRAGTVSYASVLSLESQLASTEAAVPQLEQRLSEAENLLATLAGQAPALWDVPDIRLASLSLPPDLPVSVPSRLVRQRPDIVVAEAVAHAASANVGVATAALLPSFTLTGAYSANGTQTSGILNGSGRAWSFGGAVAAPVFEGGTLWFRRRAATDQYHQAIAQYQSVVLASFAQVADSLRALDHDAEALNAQEEALRTAKEALHLIQINYEAGLATYLDVLTSNSQYHQAVINDLQAIAARYQDTVALYVALGGGWSATPAASASR